jgi:hypothetical protein
MYYIPALVIVAITLAILNRRLFREDYGIPHHLKNLGAHREPGAIRGSASV